MLVSARLLVGPGMPSAVSGGAHLPAACMRNRRWRGLQDAARSNSDRYAQARPLSSSARALDSTFFTRSIEYGDTPRRGNASSSSSFMLRHSARSGRTHGAPPSLFPFANSLLLRHWKQKHIAAAAAPSYAPSSDDPVITTPHATRTGDRGATLQELAGRPIMSPEQAITAGYRIIEPQSLSSLARTYRQLAKVQLTFLVTLTGMAGYALCPSTLAVSTSVSTLLLMTGGTALCSASANAINQLVESPYDAQMPRTRNRPLPSRSVTPLHAASFAAASGALGVSALTAINPLTGMLGLANVVLYAGVYTPTKRITIANTWIGSIVGAIPPLIGWTACTGTLHLATDLPGWTLAALMFAWQFPHFNSLAHTLRREYARGGYRMMSVTDPALNRRTSLRYAISLLPICSVLLPWTGVVHWSYAFLSAPINAALVWASYGFWRHDGDKPARLCFWVSLLHLPAVLLLAMACKTDVIEGMQRRLGLVDEGKIEA